MQLPDSMPGRDSAQKADTSLGSTVKKAAKKEGKPEEKRPAHLQLQVSCHGNMFGVAFYQKCVVHCSWKTMQMFQTFAADLLVEL